MLRPKALMLEAMEVILVTAVVVMVHVLAIMAIDMIKGDRFQQFFENVNGWNTNKDW